MSDTENMHADVDQILKSGKDKTKNMKMAMAERASRRRATWVDFHSAAIQTDEEHEQKLRYNYFVDAKQTNAALHDFRPSTMEGRSKRSRMVMKTDRSSMFKTSQNVPSRGPYEIRQMIVKRERAPANDKQHPFRMGDKTEMERMKRQIATNIKADSDSFDMALATYDPKWRTVDKKRWMNTSN